MKKILICATLALSACGPKVDVEKSVREPADHRESVVDVQPMLPEAVKLLMQQAREAETRGQIQTALNLILRAKQIQPDSAHIHQQLAETYLANGEFDHAFEWSSQVVNHGPDKGTLCERARRTLAIAAEHLGQAEQQQQALDAIAQCSLAARQRH